MKYLRFISLLTGMAMVWQPAAHAQFGDPHPVDIIRDEVTLPTADSSVEQNTSDIDTSSQNIMQSVTTGGGAGNYTPIRGYISNLNQALFSGVNKDNYIENFPGWVKLPANSTTIAAGLTKSLLTTYGNALIGAQSQSSELEGEDFSNIEQTSANTQNLLTAVQANTEAILAVAQQLQYERQLLISLITIQSVKAADELNERAQAAATSATSPLGMAER